MREITTHHDGHGLNELVGVLAVDEPGIGGASHRYEFYRKRDGGLEELASGPRLMRGDAPSESEAGMVGFLQFQQGARGTEGSTPGLTTASVIAMLIDHHKSFQAGPYPSRETALVITKLEEALHWVRHRADERAARGVLGKEQK